MRYSGGRIEPKIEIVDLCKPILFKKEDKRIKVDVGKAAEPLDTQRLRSPKESMEEIVRAKIGKVSFGWY